MNLFINACIRKESRTKRLADCLLNQLGSYEEVNLNKMDLQPLDEETLKRRTKYIENQEFNHSMFDLAKQFASADKIIIAAPFWDYSFPAILKIYLENIYVMGIVSCYGKDGIPIGLCKASKLYYVTTAGGPYIPDFSYGYIKEIATSCFGIKETQLIKAEMLDVDGQDIEKILLEVETNMET